MNMVIVGGTFNNKGGKSSHIISKIHEKFNCTTLNGGFLAHLYEFRPKNIDVLIWMPNVDNSEDKILPRLKVMNPKMILISSKRVIEKNYSNWELVNRAINTKSNLSIIITKFSYGYEFSLIDPLGNIFCERYNLHHMLGILKERINKLLKVRRMGSLRAEFDIFPNSDSISNKFVDIVRDYGKRFSEVIQANNPKRFLGNASTRCEWGFPSVRNSVGAFVSKRNVDKEGITKDNFVKTWLCADRIVYVDNKKPSVDTPVQLTLYSLFPNINYMIHGHCYIENVPVTKNKLPCGDLNEVGEIVNVVKDFNTNFAAINLYGHGCIIMAQNLEDFDNITLKSRPLLEN